MLALTFSSCTKNGLIRSISKFMTSQPGQQTIAIQLFPNISQSKNNQAMKLVQLTEYNNKITIFLQNSYRK